MDYYDRNTAHPLGCKLAIRLFFCSLTLRTPWICRNTVFADFCRWCSSPACTPLSNNLYNLVLLIAGHKLDFKWVFYVRKGDKLGVANVQVVFKEPSVLWMRVWLNK